MKRFAWKIFWCLLPVVLSALIVGYNFNRYRNGQGGFKLGVDLAGGTDLIYAVDVDKFPDGKLPQGYSSQQLTASLKQRIDPADLYNVTIRPVSETRVEIILPTGGEHQAKAEQAVWGRLIEEVVAKWPPKQYKVAIGRKTELVARVNEQHPEKEVKEEIEGQLVTKLSNPIRDVEKFINDNYNPAAGQQDDAAWQKLLTQAKEKWPPQTYDVSRGRIPVLVNRVHEQYLEESPKEIAAAIEEKYKTSKERGYLTSEQVNEVKELISRVGTLEFRIIANTHDDTEAINAAKQYFSDAQKNPETKAKLEALALAGKPPPGPVSATGDPTFPTATSIGRYSYSWVELGIKERRALQLHNAAANEPENNTNWKQVAEAREKGETVLLPIWGGTLVYSRNALNPRLSEKEANKKLEYFVLMRDPEKGKEVTGDFLIDASSGPGKDFGLAVHFQFNQEGGARFFELTNKNKPASESSFHRILAVILDGYIESAASLNDAIRTQGEISMGRSTGKEQQADVDRLVRILKTGALKASLKPQPVSETTMGPTLGQDTIAAGTFSVALAFIAILAFMVVYYRFAGFVACLALLANLLLTIAFMSLVQATFTLPGLAGLVLMLGMAVDANVLIYERLREERDRGASLPLAIRNGYDRAFPTIIDTHLSSIFTAIVLYVIGNDQLKGFGISLTVGLLISLFTSLYMTRLMFDVWQHKGWLYKLSMFRLFSRPNIDFMAIRYYWFTATIVLTIVGAAVFISRLDQGGLNIDFTKGTAYTGKLTQFMNMQELRSQLLEADLPAISVEQIFVNDPEFSNDKGSKLFTVRTSEQNVDKVQEAISQQLKELLAKTRLHDFKIDPDGKHAVLSFVDPATGELAFASRAQVGLLLTRAFNKQALTADAQDFVLEGLGTEKEGHFRWMDLQTIRPVERSQLEAVLKATQADLENRPQPERLENFDSALAQETQLRALYAILASWGAILLYLWFRFGNWTFGLAAVLCLIHDLFFTLGIIAFCHFIHEWWPGLASALLIQDFKIDLPTVAALLTLVGYSVNDTIVVFDRIREVRGKNPLLTAQTINDSVNQTLSRTLLTSFATWLVVIVLYIWGGEGVHLFAFVMVVGVIVGTYSSIYIASPLLLIFGEGRPRARVRDLQPQAEPAGV